MQIDMKKLEKLAINSINKLIRIKNEFSNYNNIEDWIFEEDEKKVDNHSKFISHIKHYILKNYRVKDIHISPSALDHILFYCIKNANSLDPKIFLQQVESIIKDTGLDQPSLVILPLHSFGFASYGIRHITQTKDIDLKMDDYIVYAQTNSIERSIKLIKEYIEEINLPNNDKLNYDLFNHFYLTRNLKWLSHNPFLIFKFPFSQDDRFDNLRIIYHKIKFLTAKLYFISILSYKKKSKGYLISTSNVNNWSTFDIFHFLTISTAKDNCDLNCLPIGYKNYLIFDVVFMNIEIYNRKFTKKNLSKLTDFVDNISKGYIEYENEENKKLLIYNRLANSIKYFNRAIKSVSDEDKIINLHTAFEVLLLDNHEKNKKKKMLDRFEVLLNIKNRKKKEKYNIEFNFLIEERNSLIHSGVSKGNEIDLLFLKKAYWKFIFKLTKDVNLIDSRKEYYLTEYYNSKLGLKVRKSFFSILKDILC